MAIGLMRGVEDTRMQAREPDDAVLETPRLQPVPKRPRGWYGAGGKRAFDVALILLLSPLWGCLYVLLALLVLVFEGPPIHHKSVRVGPDGEEFWIIKFRTMRVDADAELDGLRAADEELDSEFKRSYKLRSDPRITRLGGLLRRLSLDELPQVLNVLKGDMSLVGPRPVLRSELKAFYGSKTAQVLSVRPGMTGLWQVSGRSLLPYEERVELDLQYVDRCGLLTDLAILMRTIPSVARGHGAF